MSTTRTVYTLPAFSQIQIDAIEKNLDTLLEKNLSAIDALLKNNATYSWENLCHPLENLQDELQQFWGPIQHLSAVMNSPALRNAVNACLPRLSDYYTHAAHNEKLFHAFESIKNSPTFSTFDLAQQKSIENELRDFKLNGVHLPKDKKEQFARISKSLSQLTHRFEENVLDATMAYKKLITDETLLSGIPEHAKNAAKNNAQKENKSGWLFTLEAPDYLAIMLHADSRALREEIYYAHTTRASELGPNAKQFDNTPVMQDIMKNRVKLAELLGFENYAQYSLAKKMVKKPSEVLSFLNELAEKTMLAARAEFDALKKFAQTELQLPELQAWDIAYASEKLRLKQYAISPEDLRPYFPEPVVVNGLFQIIERLYDVTLEKVDHADRWHPDVTCFRLLDKQKNIIAHLFFDLYARANKRGGAWMDECRVRRRLDNNTIQLPAAYVTCNFNAPINNNPALFTHDDVVTLFHECGHALQHLLTKIDVMGVSGIQGIPWDAVEIASQFFENWAWEKTSVDYVARHYQTSSKLPDTLYDRMDKAKNFQSAMQMLRQLEFALFDFQLHIQFDEKNAGCVQTILNNVRQKIAVVIPPEFNRFQHSFTHIFGGGYAAGYYSYKWAEVMACDIFSAFQEQGIFNHMLSEKFKNTFLESGGAKDPMDLFIAFRGRKPNVDALLKQSGIA